MTDLDKLRNTSNIPAFVFLRGRNLSMHFSLWFIIFNIFWWAAFFFLPPESQLSSKRPLFPKEVFSLLPWQTVWRAGRTSSRSSWGILAWVDSRASSQHITPHHISHFTYHITTAQHSTSHHTSPSPLPNNDQSGAFLSWLPHQLCHSRNLLGDLNGAHCSGEDSLCSQDLSSLFSKAFPDRKPQLLYCSPRPVSPLGNHCPYWSTCHCGPGVTVSSGIITCLGDNWKT